MDLFEKLLKDRGHLGSHSHVDDNYYMFPKLEGEIAPQNDVQGQRSIDLEFE